MTFLLSCYWDSYSRVHWGMGWSVSSGILAIVLVFLTTLQQHGHLPLVMRDLQSVVFVSWHQSWDWKTHRWNVSNNTFQLYSRCIMVLKKINSLRILNIAHYYSYQTVSTKDRKFQAWENLFAKIENLYFCQKNVYICQKRELFSFF